MRSQEEIVQVASLLAIRLQKRATRILESNRILTRKVLGIAPDVSDERAETLQDSLERAVANQQREALQYAALRWVLGATESIEADNLDLNV